MNGLDMLEDMGVRVIEVDGLSRAAAYVPGVSVLLIRPDASAATWAQAVDVVLLGATEGTH